MPKCPGFKAVKCRKLRTLLERHLGYEVDRVAGSHRVMKADGRPEIVLAFSDGDEVGPHMCRDILVKQVGLSLEEAREVFKRV